MPGHMGNEWRILKGLKVGLAVWRIVTVLVFLCVLMCMTQETFKVNNCFPLFLDPAYFYPKSSVVILLLSDLICHQ